MQMIAFVLWSFGVGLSLLLMGVTQHRKYDRRPKSANREERRSST